MQGPATWQSYYRQILRQVHALPDVTMRTFFHDKARATFARKSVPEKHRRKLLKRLTAANSGELKPMRWCMEFAYARRGPVAKQRIEDLLQEASSGDNAPLIPAISDSKLPYYTPRLKAYLTASASMASGKSPSTADLVIPPTLPERADPSSEAARLLGRLSRRREVNIHWRYLARFRTRLIAPITDDEAHKISALSTSARVTDSKRDRLPKDQIAGKRPRTRFLRRRYAELLDKGVQMETRLTKDGKQEWHVKRPTADRDEARRFKASPEEKLWISC